MLKTLLVLIASALLVACSGVETIPDDTGAFAATGYSRYAWRSEPLKRTGYSKSRLYDVDPAIRNAVNARLAELGYREVPRQEAQFLIDYVAAAGLNDGQPSNSASNIYPLPIGAANRQINQAEVDNAIALSGVREMGRVALVFLEGDSQALIWKVLVSALVENTNRVDPEAIGRAMRKGLSTLPAAPD
jgi:hypothetical protein